MSSLELWAKKATEKCSEEVYDRVFNEVRQLETGWESVQSRVAEEKAQLESHRMQLDNYDDAVKRELAWMKDVERYFTDAVELCSDLAEKKSRLQRTKVNNIFTNYKSSWCIVYACILLLLCIKEQFSKKVKAFRAMWIHTP